MFSFSSEQGGVAAVEIFHSLLATRTQSESTQKKAPAESRCSAATLTEQVKEVAVTWISLRGTVRILAQ